MNIIRNTALLLAAILSLSPTAANASFNMVDAKVLYVTHVGTDIDPCTLESPCDLQTALGLAVSGDQIWVAAGIYKTTTKNVGSDKSFFLVNGVAIYGGFPIDGGDWTTRDWVNNRTILSGDVNITDSLDSFHVVRTNSDNDQTTILDGFVITEGKAFYFPPDEEGKGGGLLNEGGSPSLNHVVFEDNKAIKGGGGMCNEGGAPTLTNVTFLNNDGHEGGGGMYNSNSSPTLTDVTFENNMAFLGGGMYNNGGSPILNSVSFSDNKGGDLFDDGNYGGGMYNYGSSPTLTHVSFTSNTTYSTKSLGYGGGIYNAANSNPVLNEVTFLNNEADYGGGIYNDQSSPEFTDVTFTGNIGGGITNYAQSHPILSNVLFADNTGGGMSNGDNSNPTLNNVRFEANITVGMSNDHSSPILIRVSFINNIGTGMLNNYSSPTLTDVNFVGNSLGGMENTDSSNPMLNNVLFQGNFGLQGGGMRNTFSSPILTNVTFTGNSATNYGGAMYNYEQSNPTLTNVTIVNNSAGVLGGGIMNFSNSDPSLTNVILWGNNLQQIFNWDGTSIPVIAYSDVQDCGGSTAWQLECGQDAGGNIDADPRFATLISFGSFTKMFGLFADSPVIDTGKPTGCPLADQRYLTRPVDGDKVGEAICDMGAFEFNFETYTFLPWILR